MRFAPAVAQPKFAKISFDFLMEFWQTSHIGNVPQNRFASFAERARLTAAVRLCGRVAPLRRTTAMRNAGMSFRSTPCHTVTSHQPRALCAINYLYD